MSASPGPVRPPGLSRRTLLASLALATQPIAARSGTQSRIVALDWGLAITLLALGITPLGVPAPHYCDLYAGAPRLPASVIDVGLLFAPNQELIYELHPDLILIPPALLPARAMLGHCGPVTVANIAPLTADPYSAARTETQRLARVLGRAGAAATLISDTERAIAAAKAAILQSGRQRPIYLINMIDNRHLRVFGPGSLYGAVLQRLGIANAWPHPSDFLPLGLEALTDEPEAGIVILTSAGDLTTPASLAANPLWQALPAVRAGRVTRIGAVLATGGLPAAQRFANLLASAVLGPQHV